MSFETHDSRKRSRGNSDVWSAAFKKPAAVIHYAAFENGHDPILTRCIRRLCYLHIQTPDEALAFMQRHRTDSNACEMVQESVEYISRIFQNQRWEIDDCMQIRLGN